MSTTGETVEAKTFVNVESCCKQTCYSKIDIDQQKNMFDKFWPHNTQQKENNYMIQCTILENMMDMPDTSKETKRLDWHYHCRYKGTTVKICKQFILNLYQIDKQRIDVIRQKLISGEALTDKRGCGKKKNQID